jgi:glutamyl-Q tRNA(Asp) synthetase
VITRFAPSPTGPLHLGHAYSAMLAQDIALENGGDFFLRIEDIDQTRSRPDWETQIYDDLKWLGVWWPTPVMRQSERTDIYYKSLLSMWKRNYIFACSCTRRDVLSAVAAPQEGGLILTSPDGLIYPGTCRACSAYDETDPLPTNTALRLYMERAVEDFAEYRTGGGVFSFQETGKGPNGETGLIEFSSADVLKNIGDIVLSRRDMGTSYHLSVVIDDAAQNITHVVRGQDLFEATKIHVILQRLLGLPTPTYHHHKLIRDENGKRLAKRDDARAISKYRADGCSPDDIRKMVGL